MRNATHVFLVACGLAACGPTPEGTGTQIDGGRTDQECFDPGLTRCNAGVYQQCHDDGLWWDVESCAFPEFCVPDLGCAECNPNNATTCDGDDVRVCNDDGTIGELVETCELETCANGSCGGGGDCEEEGVKLIYVVDQNYNLLSFDPGNGNVFSLIGQLDCPAGQTLPDFGAGPATPFSMSVDRNALAWVLYTSGQIFHVSTTDASCSPTSWVPGSSGYELFGMGFVADTPGSSTEKLYISGGDAANINSGNVAFVDPATLAVTTVGPFAQEEYSPELSGTGNAELYGYFPGTTSTYVARLDRATGGNSQTWNLPPVGTGSGFETVIAWAFAHWGGHFFIFVTWTDLFEQSSDVYELDPMTGSATKILSAIPYVIVGAGVSTCAPVVIE